jgi:hypothetical protein
MTTTWQIIDLKSQIADGLVTKITYKCKVKLENDSNQTIGEITLTGDSTNPNFVPFSDLTEQTVIGWVQSSLGEDQVTAIETKLQNRISAHKAAKEAETEQNGLPWRR